MKMLKYELVKGDWKLTYHNWGFVAIDNLQDENESYVWQDYDNSDDEHFKSLCDNRDWENVIDYIVKMVS